MAMVAEQPSKYAVSSSDEYEEIQENSTIIEENPNDSNAADAKQNGTEIQQQRPRVGEHDIHYEQEPPNDANDDEKKEEQMEQAPDNHQNQADEEDEDDDSEDEEEPDEEDLNDDAEITTKKTQDNHQQNEDAHDHEDEENKYNSNINSGQHHDDDIITNGVRTDSASVAEVKKPKRRHDRHRSSSHRSSRHHHKKRKKHRHRKIDWTQYQVFKPHDYNDRKVMSNKYTIWIDTLKPNTAYFLKLRGCNKYGKGDWTSLYSFVTKMTSFEFKSCVVKDAESKNAIFEMLNKKLPFHAWQRGHNSDTHQFALRHLFSSEKQGFSAAKFHEACDNKQRTLVIAESEYGTVFGGYTDLSWSSSPKDKWKNDKHAFLFLLRNEQRKLVSLVFECIDQYNATRSNINSGPCFGAGLDLYIGDNCNKSDISYSTPKSYNIPPQILLGGKKNFRVKNYDVYMVV